MTGSLIVARRFCGPPDIGNGGRVCGLAAAGYGVTRSAATGTRSVRYQGLWPNGPGFTPLAGLG